MALQRVTFQTRALTSLVFVAVMLTGLLWNTWSFFVLFSIIHFGCWYEFQKLVALIDPAYKSISRVHRYGVMIAGWCVVMYCSRQGFPVGNYYLHDAGLWGGILFLFVLPVAEIGLVRKPNLKNIGWSMLGLLYISLSIGLLTNIRTFYPGDALDDVNKLFVMVIILSLWINDTMAYLVGSVIGKTPFSSISPKKTWEGTIGGIVITIVAMGAAGYFVSSVNQSATMLKWACIAAIAGIMGTIGDLLESKLKRMANVKDSGQILPGHGGFLDRFDSLLFATPWIWLYIIMFVK